MISIILKTILNLITSKFSSIISWFKKYYKLIAVIIIMILAAFLFYYHNLVNKKNKEIDRITSNYEYYMNKASDEENSNKVLQLTLNEFKNSKDSLVQKMQVVQKQLKIKEKELEQVQLQEQRVVLDTTIIVKTQDFNVEIKPNALTSIIINKHDSILTHKLDIRNTQTLFLGHHKEYRNKYKNWITRLFHFDFKKKLIYQFQIHNSNDLIQITDTRLIEISK